MDDVTSARPRMSLMAGGSRPPCGVSNIPTYFTARKPWKTPFRIPRGDSKAVASRATEGWRPMCPPHRLGRWAIRPRAWAVKPWRQRPFPGVGDSNRRPALRDLAAPGQTPADTATPRGQGSQVGRAVHADRFVDVFSVQESRTTAALLIPRRSWGEVERSPSTPLNPPLVRGDAKDVPVRPRSGSEVREEVFGKGPQVREEVFGKEAQV